MANANYETTHGVYPPGRLACDANVSHPVCTSRVGNGTSPFVLLLPFLEQVNLYNLDAAIEAANWPQGIRGFGHVKQTSVDAARDSRQAALQHFAGAESTVSLQPFNGADLAVAIYKP